MQNWIYDLLKIGTTALVVYAVSESARRSTLFASLVASLPLTSLLAIVWLRMEGGETTKIASLAMGIFWLVLPSLVFFLLLPFLLRRAWTFWPALAAACGATIVAYLVFFRCLRWAGVAT